MTAEPPPESPTPVPVVLPPAAATIDLSGGDETPVAAAGRIIGGLLTMLIGGILAIGLFVGYVAGAFIPPIETLFDVLGDFALYGAALAAGIAITGFTVMRRGKKVRAQEAAEEAAMMTRLKAAGALDGTATPETLAAALDDQPRTGDMDARTQKPIPPSATGSETHL